MKQQSDHYFDDFEELSPSFLPTFKLKPGTLCYDLYKKNQHYRPPGWYGDSFRFSLLLGVIESSITRPPLPSVISTRRPPAPLFLSPTTCRSFLIQRSLFLPLLFFLLFPLLPFWMYSIPSFSHFHSPFSKPSTLLMFLLIMSIEQETIFFSAFSFLFSVILLFVPFLIIFVFCSTNNNEKVHFIVHVQKDIFYTHSILNNVCRPLNRNPTILQLPIHYSLYTLSCLWCLRLDS